MANRVAVGIASYKGFEPGPGAKMMRTMYDLGRNTDWECDVFVAPRKHTHIGCNALIDVMEEQEQEKSVRYTHFVYLDDDVEPESDTIRRLVNQVSVEHPVVFALAFYRQYPYWPSIWRAKRSGTSVVGWERIHDYPKDALIQIQASGLCAAAFHREALASIQKPYFDWQCEGYKQAGYTPDGYLCNKFLERGIGVYCHTGIQVKHLAPPPPIGEAEAIKFKDHWGSPWIDAPAVQNG